MSNAIVYLTNAVVILKEEMDTFNTELCKQYDENLDLKIQKIDHVINRLQEHIDNLL